MGEKRPGGRSGVPVLAHALSALGRGGERGELEIDGRQRQQASRPQHAEDLEKGRGWAPLPDALHRKKARAGYELGWQFLFPASTINLDPATGLPPRCLPQPAHCHGPAANLGLSLGVQALAERR